MEYNGHKVFIDNGYPAIYLPDNPNSKSNGAIRLHVLEMQKKLNRPISPLEVIHHKDENKENYDINNLICFATSSDHIAYHKGGPIVFDKDGIARCVEKKTIKINGNLYNKCPKCSKLKSLDSFLCSDCYKKENIKRPSYEELVINYELLHTYSAIGKKYGVSDNAVKKWFKFYKINKKPYYMYDIPDRNLLLNKFLHFC